MPSNHLILCRPLLLLPSVIPSIRVFSNESALRIRWPKYWSFSFNISPSNEHPGLISFRMDWLDLLAVQGTLLLWFLVVNFKHLLHMVTISWINHVLEIGSKENFLLENFLWNLGLKFSFFQDVSGLCDWSHTMTQVAFAILIHLLPSSLLRPENVSWLSSKFPLLRCPWFSQERKLANLSQLAPD